MGKRFIYSVSLAVLMAGSAVGVSGASLTESVMTKEAASEDGFDVQRDFYKVEELIGKHFPDKRIYKSYKGPSLEEYGVFYIDNDNNRYVFLSDKDDAKARYFKRALKEKLGVHIEIKDSKYPYMKLRGIQDEIAKNYDFFSVGADIIEQVVEVSADWDEAKKIEVKRKYGDAVSIEVYDPGAIATDGDGRYANWPEPVQQVGGPNDKVYWPPHSRGLFFGDAASKALDDEVYAKTGFPRFDGKLFDKYGTYVQSSGELPEGRLTYGMNRLPEDMKVRISLTELDPALRPVSEIWSVVYDHPHGMNVEFPDRRNVMFALRLELLDKNGDTVDARMNLYAFELDEINAKLEIDAEAYDQTGVIAYNLTNWGPTSLTNNGMDAIQKWDSERWKWLNGPGGASSLMLMISTPPNEVLKGEIAVKGLSLEPGEYRLVKYVGAEEGTASTALYVPFEIVP